MTSQRLYYWNSRIVVSVYDPQRLERKHFCFGTQYSLTLTKQGDSDIAAAALYEAAVFEDVDGVLFLVGFTWRRGSNSNVVTPLYSEVLEDCPPPVSLLQPTPFRLWSYNFWNHNGNTCRKLHRFSLCLQCCAVC